MQPSSEAAERVFSLLENSFKTGLHGNFIDVIIIHKLPHPFFWSIIILELAVHNWYIFGA